MNGTVPASGETTTLGAEDCSTHAPKPAPWASGRFYRPELDVVRFLAFLFVFLSHSLPSGSGPSTASLPRGLAKILYTSRGASRFGLSLFFTLSAFLICELLLREREATGVVLAKQFYIRRILRIWPLYFAGLAIGLVVALFSLIPGGNQGAIAWVAWSTVLLGNWYVVFHGFPNCSMGPLWSISVEEQFYLIAPWAIKFINRRSLSGVAIAVIVCANVWLFCLGAARAPYDAIWYNSFVQFENFAAGLLLCLVLRGRMPGISVWTRLTLLGVSASCWYFASNRLDVYYAGDGGSGSWLLIGGYGLVALGCVLLLVAFLGLDRKVFPSWAIYLGRISYGLYVFHMLAIRIAGSFPPHYSTFGGLTMLFKGACAFGFTLLLATLSYRYFETPFLRMKKRHEVIASRPV